MKKANRLLEKAADPENLRLAFWKAKKGKSYAGTVMAYQARLENNLSRLREQILSGDVEVGNYHFFKVFDPKERQICAPAFAEQVLHHALMNVCHERFERAQVFDSYASRKGKGTHAALQRAAVFTRQHAWFLKLDVRKFFGSIHHEVLKAQLAKLFREGRILDIFEKIIDSYQERPLKEDRVQNPVFLTPQQGLPIGNLTSQYFANHYLAGLDHFVREHLGPGGYVRYMDDMLLWANEKQELKESLSAVRAFINDELRCELKPELLNRPECGLPFLGYLIFPHQIRLARRSKRRFAEKWAKLDGKYHSGEWDEAVCQRHVLPLVAFTAHAEAWGFRRKVMSGK